MKTFSVEQINKAYENADSRVLRGIEKVKLNQLLIKLREEHSFPIDKLDELRTAIDFVFVGLISARDLTQKTRELFGEKSQEIINKLNKQVFQPVLEYVRTHQPVEDVLIQKKETDTKTDPLKESNIQILEDPDGDSTNFVEPVKLNKKPNPIVVEPVLTPIDIIPTKPSNKKEAVKPMSNIDPYQEPIT